MLKLGSHISFNKKNNYLEGAIKESLDNGANAMMIYLGAPQSTARVDVSNYSIDEYKQNYADVITPKDIMVHAPYVVNPASVEKHVFAIEFLIKEIKRMNAVGITTMVLHPGAHTSFTREEALNTLVKSLKKIIAKTKDVNILIETMSGKGSEIGTSFEELKWIMEQVNNPRIGICIDTCHIWDAGIDFSDDRAFVKYLKKIDVLKYVGGFHINDSKNPFEAHKDRHANLGKGYIPLQQLRNIVHAPEFDGMIMVLETPRVNGKPSEYKKEIALLRQKD